MEEIKQKLISLIAASHSGMTVTDLEMLKLLNLIVDHLESKENQGRSRKLTE